MFLTTFYGDVPLITAPLSSFDEFSQPRTPVSEIYQKIIEDFSFAKENLTRDGNGYTGMLPVLLVLPIWQKLIYIIRTL